MGEVEWLLPRARKWIVLGAETANRESN